MRHQRARAEILEHRHPARAPERGQLRHARLLREAHGYGYRNHGGTSPYAFAGTNQYPGGLYVADGKYSPTTFDRRPGIVAIAQEYMKH